MPNASDASMANYERILIVGRTGSGKSTLIRTLEGKKFAYLLDPNSLSAVRGLDLDYELFLPDFLEMDATLKGFNKNSTSDLPRTKKEPTVYNRWVDDINNKVEKGFFKEYKWLIIDSLTFLGKAVMDRQLFINKRYGDIEELGDYRVVGSKIADVFGSITALPINLYCTGHIDTFQDELTKKIETQIRLPGKARNILPLQFTNVWLAQIKDGEKEGVRYELRTRPDPKGLQDVRSSIAGLSLLEDVTIEDMNNPTKFGINRLIKQRR